MDILYADTQIVVCIKPVGTVSQGDAPDAMPALLSAQTGGKLYPVHRLDRLTGGVMVYARTQQAAAKLSETIRDGALEKEYLAVVSGVPEKAEDTLEDLLFFDRRKNKSYVVSRRRAGVKDASLCYRVLAQAQGLSLLRIRLHTGRTHQIRVQFASRGLPLLGDGKYGSCDNRCSVALWSAQLRFAHPQSGQALCFGAQPPREFPWTVFEQTLLSL